MPLTSLSTIAALNSTPTNPCQILDGTLVLQTLSNLPPTALQSALGQVTRVTGAFFV